MSRDGHRDQDGDDEQGAFRREADALVLRKRALEDIISEAPATIAQRRMLYFRSEHLTDKHKLESAQKEQARSGGRTTRGGRRHRDRRPASG